MSEKLRLLLVTVFLTAAIVSSGCRSRGVGLDTAMPGGGATPPQAALLPFFGQSPINSTTTAEPDGFSEYGDEPQPTGGSAIPIGIARPATRTTPGPNLPADVLDTSPGAFSDERFAVPEDFLLAGGATPSGTRPGGRRLDILPRNNPEAADLLDHWGQQRNQTIAEGLSLTPSFFGSGTFDLQTLRPAVEGRTDTTVAPNLQAGDEVRILGTRRGLTYGRLASSLQDNIDSETLANQGMTIPEETEKPETYELAGWTDYAAFTVSVSRDLQIALADPQPHYGDGSSPWEAFDVIDLLQAEVDAFGYLSTGSFRQSHAAKGPDGTVHYAGGLLGAALDRTGFPPVTGDATLSVNLATLDGRASFTSLRVYPDGTPEAFAGGSLHYPIELSANSIVGTAPGATFQADFYGPKHEDIAGVLHDPQAGLLAGFGATLDERSVQKDVIVYADFMAGLSYQRGSANPVNDGWYQYRCGTAGACVARDAGPGGWNPWATTSRENVLASSTGWIWRNTARPEADYDFLRLERFTSASTDGGRGRYVVDGLTGTLEHMTFGFGFERSRNWETDARSDDFINRWTGVQGTLSASLPGISARWSGLMVGYQSNYDWGENPFVEGRATVDYSLSSNLVDVKFSRVASRDGKRVLSDFGFENLRAAADGTFRGGTEGIIHGSFFGPAHEEAGGMFHHNAAEVNRQLRRAA